MLVLIATILASFILQTDSFFLASRGLSNIKHRCRETSKNVERKVYGCLRSYCLSHHSHHLYAHFLMVYSSLSSYHPPLGTLSSNCRTTIFFDRAKHSLPLPRRLTQHPTVRTTAESSYCIKQLYLFLLCECRRKETQGCEENQSGSRDYFRWRRERWCCRT